MRRCLILLALLLPIAACETHTDRRVGPTDMGTHRWLYYYDADVYFCPDHKHYWRLLPAEGRWVETEQLERHIDISYKPYRVIDEASPYPYREHRKHVRQAREWAGK